MAEDDRNWVPTAEEEAEWEAEWAEEDRAAASLLEELCAEELRSKPPLDDLATAVAALYNGLESKTPPFDYFRRACGWTAPPDLAYHEAWIGAVASTISPPDDPGTDPEEQAAVESLLHADWLGLVVGLVRRGIGAEFSGALAFDDIERLPEIEGESEDPADDVAALRDAVEVLAPLWQALGVLDDARRLTAIGRWGLPHALLVTWFVPDDGPAGP